MYQSDERLIKLKLEFWYVQVTFMIIFWPPKWLQLLVERNKPKGKNEDLQGWFFTWYQESSVSSLLMWIFSTTLNGKSFSPHLSAWPLFSLTYIPCIRPPELAVGALTDSIKKRIGRLQRSSGLSRVLNGNSTLLVSLCHDVNVLIGISSSLGVINPLWTCTE